MRIGYFMNSYPMTSTTFIRREIHAIEAQGVEVTRYAIRPWDAELVDPKDQAEQAVTRYVLSGRVGAMIGDFARECVSNPKGMWRAICGLARLMRNAGGDVVPHVAYLLEAVSLKQFAQADGIAHLHTHFSTNSAAVAMLCHRLGGPGYSFTAHGPDEFDDWHKSSLGLKIHESRFAVAISHFCKSQLARASGMGAWGKLHIVRCGIDVSEFSETGAPFDDDAPFVSVGRLCPQKAQVLVIEAVAQVARTHPEVQVVLIGDGESRAEVEAGIRRHGLQDNVTLLGWQANDQVRAHLGRARALLLPSFAEGLPVVIMEALALGRPAISTYIAGIPELVDDGCGWIIPAGSAEHIAQAMRETLEASAGDLADRGAEGRARVVDQHDIEKNAARLLGLIRDAV
ncbi:glycosyltransferase [Actibacterium sp. XHP0104]|uniref:glycosyltransferase n=1 Tax=Actibacterium sp. XHP0104 TaxID=2984335 RepID=UPI0021E8A3AA|nr:glycosyltransferase [Actibacterium sp. XHP0104]MCV2881863.1 glycosyltransferase [Actibacterium sp. XHP0104]